MKSDEIETTEDNRQLAMALTNAYFTNLLIFQNQGLDTSSEEVKDQCFEEVYGQYWFTLEMLEADVEPEGE
jgi:hypothetical protein